MFYFKGLDYQEVSGGVCGAVIDHVFNHEVSEDEFDHVDANGDGVLEPEELLAFAEENAHHLGRASQRMFELGMYLWCLGKLYFFWVNCIFLDFGLL